jgi:membrane protein implicated in regulation of membrane protease activity
MASVYMMHRHVIIYIAVVAVVCVEFFIYCCFLLFHIITIINIYIARRMINRSNLAMNFA